MNEILEIILRQYEVLLLIFVRMTGTFVMSPLFSRNNIPNILKVGFAIIISFIIATTIDINIQFDSGSIIVIIIRELFVGLIIGFVSYIFFTSLYIAGQIIDMQIGFGMVNVIDPQYQVQIPVLGNFFYIVAILVYLITNGHHFLIKAIVASYRILPIGEYLINKNLYFNFIKIITEVFIIGFKISGPVLAVIFITNVLLGILARVMPQMNVFIVGMPLKIVIGIATIIITIPLYILALEYIFDNIYEEIFSLFKLLKQKG